MAAREDVLTTYALPYDEDDPRAEHGHQSLALLNRLNERERELAALHARQRTLQQSQVQPAALPAISETMLDAYLAQTRAVLLSEAVKLARHLLDRLVAKIVVVGKTGTISYTFPFNDITGLRMPSGEGFGAGDIGFA